MGPRTLKLVHTSDVHLASDAFEGERRRASRMRVEAAFSRVVDAVGEEQADLFLIAGDLFDSGRVDRPSIDFVLSELRRVACPVVLLPGNHDCYDDHSVYRSVDFREAGRHVHTLKAEAGEALAFTDLGATVWGRPIVDHHHSNRPLHGLCPPFQDWWHIGIAHGLVAPDRSDLRSSVITPDEIEASGLDYLAIGHVHVFRDVSQESTKACYSGSPAPLHLGPEEAGSLAVVELDRVSGVRITERLVKLS